MRTQINTLLKQRNKLRFLVGYLLWRTGISGIIHTSAYGVKYKFYHSAISRMIFADKHYVRSEYELLHKILAKDDVFIDVGANIGTWSLMASNIVGDEGMVLSFEPHPKTFSFLLGNIRLNKSKNIHAHNLGLSDQVGAFFLTDGVDDTNHLTDDINGGIKIELRRLDDFTEDISKIKLLKIDVEGFEWFVLKGAEQTISKCTQIVFESDQLSQKKAGYHSSDLLSWLIGHDFSIYRTETGEQIEQTYISPYCENLIAIRNNHPELLESGAS